MVDVKGWFFFLPLSATAAGPRTTLGQASTTHNGAVGFICFFGRLVCWHSFPAWTRPIASRVSLVGVVKCPRPECRDG